MGSFLLDIGLGVYGAGMVGCWWVGGGFLWSVAGGLMVYDIRNISIVILYILYSMFHLNFLYLFVVSPISL